MATSKVLIVEDDPVSLRKTQVALSKALGSTVRCIAANDCSQMRDAITQHSIDLVIMDLHLPDATGLEVLEQLRLINEDVPVIILTGSGDAETRMRALASGVGAYLEKTPTGLLDLPMVAVQMLESKRHERRHFRAIQQQLQSMHNSLEDLRRQHRERLEYLELVVLGTPKEPGLLKKEEENTRFRKTVQKLYWMFIGGIITTVASAAVALAASRIFQPPVAPH